MAEKTIDEIQARQDAELGARRRRCRQIGRTLAALGFDDAFTLRRPGDGPGRRTLIFSISVETDFDADETYEGFTEALRDNEIERESFRHYEERQKRIKARSKKSAKHKSAAPKKAAANKKGKRK